MKPLTLVLAPLVAAAALAAEPPATPTPAPAATRPPLAINLDRLDDLYPNAGHAEFNLSMRHDLLADPMVRLSLAVGREESSARTGRGITFPVTYSAAAAMVTMPGPGPGRALAGPWGADWSDLSTQEKIGRAAEGGIFAGLIIGIAHALR